jgi:transcriptional regulator with XRE-family HTH domain
MDVRKIGAFISELRKSKNYTQLELAQLLNVTHQAVSKWERGESLPDIGLLIPTAKLLGVTVDELLNGEYNPALDKATATEPIVTAVESQVVIEDVPINPGQSSLSEQLLTLDHVSKLAPFLSKETLETMIEKADGEVHWSNIKKLAPFLGRATLEKLVEKVIDGTIEPKMIKGIAPFISHKALDRLVSHVEEGSIDWEVISGLSPFLSKETLSRLVQRVADGSLVPDNILGLAPFLNQSDLVMLIEKIGLNGLLPEHLTGLAPFLSQAQIEKLVLGFRV